MGVRGAVLHCGPRCVPSARPGHCAPDAHPAPAGSGLPTCCRSRHSVTNYGPLIMWCLLIRLHLLQAGRAPPSRSFSTNAGSPGAGSPQATSYLDQIAANSRCEMVQPTLQASSFPLNRQLRCPPDGRGESRHRSQAHKQPFHRRWHRSCHCGLRTST